MKYYNNVTFPRINLIKPSAYNALGRFIAMNYRNLFVGIDNKVTLANGTTVVPVNFDNGATTPPMKCAVEAIYHDLPWYGAIGRSNGQKNRYCTERFNATRNEILRFFHLEPNEDHAVVYVKTATEGLNLLAHTLLSESRDMVLTTRMEHHANLLPWRYNASKVCYVELDNMGRVQLSEIESKLRYYGGRIKIVAITAASNVTGYVNDINKIARVCHRYGAKIVVDGAQIVAHRDVNLKGNNPGEAIDFFAFSAHKVYAPFGGGVVVGLKKVLSEMDPFLRGGGAIDQVFDYNETWLDSPERMEAGTQNYFGVISMVAALQQLKKISFEQIEKHESELKDYLIQNLKRMPNVILYGDTQMTKDRLGVIGLNLVGIDHKGAANILSSDAGIATRDGKFCAHPYVTRLLGVPNFPYNEEEQDECGMVRLSLGLYNTREEADRVLAFIYDLSRNM